MKMNIYSRTFFFICAFLLVLGLAAPVLSRAAGFPYWAPSNNPILSCNTQRDENGNITNPCGSCDLFKTAQNFIFFMLTLLVFILAPAMIAVGGIMIMVAGAHEGWLETGKKILTGAVVGLAIGVGAWAIVNTFIGLFAPGTSISSTWSTINCSDVQRLIP